MTQPNPRTLTDAERGVFAVLADTLIPATADGPSASEAQVAGHWIDVTLAERADLLPALRRELAAFAGGDARAHLERCERERPAGFAALSYAVAASFFRSPVAMAWLGHDRVRDEYEGAEPEPSALTDELLRPVRALPPLFRPTPPDPGGTR